MSEISDLVAYLVERRASDLHLKAGCAPFLRIAGRLESSDRPVLTAADMERLSAEVLPPARAAEFAETGEADFALSISGLGRFRLSIIRQRGSTGMVFRRVVTAVPTFDALGLPPSVRQLAERRRGLLLVTGPADSGKSTTVATMIDHINEHSPVSIITIEDPIEVLYADKKAFVHQREVGTDTQNHLAGFRQSLRHDPDVIFVDRIDNAELMAEVLAAASARLIISTLSSPTVEETIEQIVSFFPPHNSRQTRHALASVLQGVICERLLDREDGRGRIAAFEVLVSTPRIQDSIMQAPDHQPIETLLAAGDYYGMQTMDQHLTELFKNRLVNLRDAVSVATHPHDMRVKLEQTPT